MNLSLFRLMTTRFMYRFFSAFIGYALVFWTIHFINKYLNSHYTGYFNYYSFIYGTIALCLIIAFQVYNKYKV